MEGQKRKKGSITINQLVEEWGGGEAGGAVQQTRALLRPPRCMLLAAVGSEQQNGRYRRAFGTGRAQRSVSWTTDAQVQYRDHFAANPEKLISVFTLLDRENPTVIPDEPQINFS